MILDNLKTQDIEAYSWLLQQLPDTDVAADSSASENYRGKYRKFWVMRFPSESYFPAYFQYLQHHKTNQCIDPKAVCRALRSESKDRKGQETIQFSFATKLAHMANPSLPIFDGLVRSFFFLPVPGSNQDFDERLRTHGENYQFLQQEYKRITQDGLLEPAIGAFRKRFPETRHTDVKVIDWIIWAFVDLAYQGEFSSGRFRYD